MVTADKDRLRHSVMNKARREIIVSLVQGEKNISGLQQQLPNNPLNRSTICYHLNILEDVGILQSKYVILDGVSSKGRAGRVYSVNHDKLIEALQAIDELKDEYKV